MTRKAERARRRFVLAPPHLAAAAVLVAAASIGLVAVGPLLRSPMSWRQRLVALSLVVVATELRPAPPRYDASLAASRGWPPAE